MHGYTQSLDYTHMYNIKDTRRIKKKSEVYQGVPQNTIIGFIANDPNFSAFNRILMLSGLYMTFATCDKYTLFVVPNDKILNISNSAICGGEKTADISFIKDIDSWTARKIIMNMSMKGYFPYEDIKTGTRQVVSLNNNLHTLDAKFYDDANIMGCQETVNGMIYILDRIVCPI